MSHRVCILVALMQFYLVPNNAGPFKYTLNMPFIKVIAKACTTVVIAVSVILLLEGNDTPMCLVRSLTAVN